MGQLSAQSGKIVGTVIDAETGETLPGANVVIQGTTTGTQTNIDGEYLLLNIEPGTYIIQCSYIGFSTRSVTDVVVRTGLTTEVDFEMMAEAFEGEEVVIQAERKMVIKDMTSSESRVSSEEIAKLPVQEINDIVQLQAGVNVGNDGALHIRGGRASEVSYVVDGVRTTDSYDNSQGLRVENSAVQELQVISGTFNAEYGQAMSGIVNIVTKSGGNSFEGQIDGWGGDYMSSRSGLYDGVTSTDNPEDFDPTNQYNLNVSLSGPIVRDKVTFFVNARRFQNEGHLKGFNAFSYHGRYVEDVPLGTDFETYRTLYNEQVDLDRPWYSTDTVQVAENGQLVNRLRLTDSGERDSSVVNMNRYESNSVLTNLQFKPMSALKFNLISSYATEEGSGYNHSNRLVPGGQSTYYRTNYSSNLKTTITPSNNTFITMNVAYKNNEYDDYLFENPYDPRFFNYDNLNQFGIQNPGRPFQYNQVNSSNSIFNRRTQTLIAKAEFSSQINNANFVKFGAEFQGDFLNFENINLQPVANNLEITVPEDIPEEIRSRIELGIPPRETANYQKYSRDPYHLSAFIQDKLELEKLTINAGVRFDYFQPNAQIPSDPQDPDITNPTKASNIYEDLNNNGVRDPNEPEITRAQREEYWYEDADPKYQFSPRLGIAYPITADGVIYFSYGYFFQMPNYSYLFNNSQILLQQTSGVYGIFGNPDLKPEKSIQYELGLKQEIARGVAIEITGFYKDSRDYVSSGIIEQTYNPSVRYATWINRDYANSKGLTVAYNQNIGRFLSLSLDYTYTVAEGSNSDPAAEFNRALAQGNESGNALTKFIQPLDWDRSHIANAAVFFSQDTWGGNLVSKFSTGTPYTPSNPFTVRYGPTASQRDLSNTARLPNRFTMDINLYKNFEIAGFTIQTFMNIYNLLDFEVINSVYADSGDPDQPLIFPETANPDYFNDPSRYAEPRRIQLGAKFSF